MAGAETADGDAAKARERKDGEAKGNGGIGCKTDAKVGFLFCHLPILFLNFNIFSLNHFRIILESCATVPPDILSPGFLLLVCASKLCSFGARQEAQMKMFEATKAWSCNQGPAKAGTNESNERLEKHGRPPHWILNFNYRELRVTQWT